MRGTLLSSQCPADLLEVVVERERCAVVYHATQIRLIDSHAEGHRRDDDLARWRGSGVRKAARMFAEDCELLREELRRVVGHFLLINQFTCYYGQ